MCATCKYTTASLFLKKSISGCPHELNDLSPVEKADDDIHRIKLKLAPAKIGTTAVFVMIIVQAFTQHQNIYREKIAGSILHFKIDIPNSMGKPVDDHTMERPHNCMDGN